MKNINAWACEDEIVIVKEKAKYQKYGTYATKGRTAMLEEANRWS